MEAVLEADLLGATPKTDKEYAALADKYLAAIESKQQRMEAVREETKVLQAETDAIIADILQTLRFS